MAGEKKHEYMFSEMPPGLYFIKVMAGGTMETFKLIKTR
jgi:hypothetical protein